MKQSVVELIASCLSCPDHRVQHAVWSQLRFLTCLEICSGVARSDSEIIQLQPQQRYCQWSVWGKSVPGPKSFWWTTCCGVALLRLATYRNLATGFLILVVGRIWNTYDLDNLDLRCTISEPLPEPCLAHLGIINSVSPKLRRGKLQTTNLTPLTGVYFKVRFLTSGLNMAKQCKKIQPTFSKRAQNKPVHLATGAGCQMNTLILDP